MKEGGLSVKLTSCRVRARARLTNALEDETVQLAGLPLLSEDALQSQCQRKIRAVFGGKYELL